MKLNSIKDKQKKILLKKEKKLTQIHNIIKNEKTTISNML